MARRRSYGGSSLLNTVLGDAHGKTTQEREFGLCLESQTQLSDLAPTPMQQDLGVSQVASVVKNPPAYAREMRV